MRYEGSEDKKDTVIEVQFRNHSAICYELYLFSAPVRKR